MFRKTDTAHQLSLQSNVYQYLTNKSSVQFTDETAWQNVFYNQVVSRIDENLFSILFFSENGAPNTPIRTLIGMMILKEGEGYSDQKLFKNCHFNLLTRKALGLTNIDDPVPAESHITCFVNVLQTIISSSFAHPKVLKLLSPL